MTVGFLELILAPLAEYYEHEEHEEIAINRPGEIWCRRHVPDRHGRTWIPVQDERFTLSWLTRACRAVANTYDQKFSPHDPTKPSTVFATLPPKEHRFAAVVGMNVVYDQTIPEGGIALCVRKGAGGTRAREIQFSDWGLVDGKGVENVSHEPISRIMSDPTVDAAKCLRDAVQLGCNILISGATSTGKTTLFNKILEEVDPRTRILTVEDTREIKLRKHPNHVHLILSRTDKNAIFKYDDAIDVIMRFTPDIVLVGEISTTNASALWKLTGTGHGAMMTTIHASSVSECCEILYERISGSMTNPPDREKTIRKIRENFCIIQMNRNAENKRVISAISRPIPPLEEAAVMDAPKEVSAQKFPGRTAA